MTLPLKFAPFERYMHVDDAERHPMAYIIRLRLSGTLDRAAFARAAATAVRHHPFLAARMAGGESDQPRWVRSPAPAPPIQFVEPGEPFRFRGSQRIDLAGENGLRIWVREDRPRDDGGESGAPGTAGNPASIDMRFQFHHCSCDGVGAYRFLEDLLCAYHEEVTGEPRQAAECDPRLLATRSRCGLSRLGMVLRAPQELWGITIGAGIFFLNRPRPLSAPARAGLSDDERQLVPEYLCRTFDAEEFQGLRKVAREAKATLNDLFLRDLFLAMADWNARHEPGRRQRLRIMIPMDLRNEAEQRMPAANQVGMALLDRRPRWFPSPRWLLASVRLEMRFIKAWRLGITFVRSCALMGAVPGLMRWMARSRRCHATSVLSNMGRVFSQVDLPRRDGKVVCGGLVLEGVESAPPVRPLTSAAFTALTYAGKLALVMNYDRETFTREAAETFLDTVADRFRASAKEGVRCGQQRELVELAAAAEH